MFYSFILQLYDTAFWLKAFMVLETNFQCAKKVVLYSEDIKTSYLGNFINGVAAKLYNKRGWCGVLNPL